MRHTARARILSTIGKAGRPRGAALDSILAWRDACPLVEISPEVVLAAANLATEHRLGKWDAMIVTVAVSAFPGRGGAVLRRPAGAGAVGCVGGRRLRWRLDRAREPQVIGAALDATTLASA